MAYDLKYGKVTVENSDSLNNSDEPVFIIRSQDMAAISAVLKYAQEASKIGASEELNIAVHNVANVMKTWQEDHPELVKVPD